jgi:hypothetical protein
MLSSTPGRGRGLASYVYGTEPRRRLSKAVARTVQDTKRVDYQERYTASRCCGHWRLKSIMCTWPVQSFRSGC